MADTRRPPSNTQQPPAGGKPGEAPSGRTLPNGMPAMRWKADEPIGGPPAAAPPLTTPPPGMSASAPTVSSGIGAIGIPPIEDGPRDTTRIPEGLGPALAHAGNAIVVNPRPTSSTTPPRTTVQGQATAVPPVQVHGGPPAAQPAPMSLPSLPSQAGAPADAGVVAPGGRVYGRRTGQVDLPWQTQVNVLPARGGTLSGQSVAGLDVAQVARAMEIARAAEIGMAVQAHQTSAIEVPVVNAPVTKTTVYKLERPVEFDRRLALLRDPDSQASAAYRVLRYRVLDRGMPRVIVVTSPRPGEGKSTCAVNLALALGECGRARVLLLEANLRDPSLAKLLAFMPPRCFAEQVTAHKDDPEATWTVVEAHSPWLHVAAVKPDRHGDKLLDGPAFAAAIDRLRRAEYDHIVIDTPAVLGSADVNIVQDCADGVVMVARSRFTAGRHLRRAMEQLAPSRVLGVTMLE